MLSLIQAKDLEVNRQGKDILQNVSIDIKKRFYYNYRAQWCWKISLLECLMGTLRPDKGRLAQSINRVYSPEF